MANFVLVSSVGADAHGKAFYLRVKGEVEAALTKLRLPPARHPAARACCAAARGGDRRPLERLAMLASPLTDLLLHGDKRRYRSIDARTVAAAALQLRAREGARALRARQRFDPCAPRAGSKARMKRHAPPPGATASRSRRC